MKNILSPGLLIILVTLIVSCSKDEESTVTDYTKTYTFLHTDFKGGITCYDSTGDINDFEDADFIKYDFIFSDGGSLPYERIEINPDSTVLFHYTKREVKFIDAGFFTIKNDTLHFYNSSFYLRFKGTKVENEFRIPVYGYKRYYISEGGYPTIRSSINFGEPDVSELLDYYSEKPSYLFIQKFDLVYDIGE